MQGLGSMKKEFQCLNSGKQIKRTCGRAQKPYLKKQLNNSFMFPKTRRLSENSVLLQTRIKEVFYHRIWLNMWWTRLGEPETAFQKQSRVRCNKQKTKLVFPIVVPSNRQRFYISELTQHLMTSLREPRYYFRKWVNVHRAILKRKIHSENFIPA